MYPKLNDFMDNLLIALLLDLLDFSNRFGIESHQQRLSPVLKIRVQMAPHLIICHFRSFYATVALSIWDHPSHFTHLLISCKDAFNFGHFLREVLFLVRSKHTSTNFIAKGVRAIKPRSCTDIRLNPQNTILVNKCVGLADQTHHFIP